MTEGRTDEGTDGGRERKTGLVLGGLEGAAQRRSSRTPPPKTQWAGEQGPLAGEVRSRGPPLQPENTVPFQLPEGPPWPRCSVQGRGQRQNGWGGGWERKSKACLSHWLFKPWGSRRQGWDRMTGGRCSAYGGGGGGGTRAQRGWAEAAGREGRCLGTGAVPSQSRWNTEARGLVTVGQSKEKTQQNVERGQTPPSIHETLPKEDSLRPTGQGSKCCRLSDETRKPAARTRAKIAGWVTGPHTPAAGTTDFP